MADVHTRAVRRYNMSRIRGKDTKPELIVRAFLQTRRYKPIVNDGSLPGKPDILLRRKKTVIFVHGCFWHGHSGCGYFVVPRTRRKWWLAKILGNKKNDRRKRRTLRDLGWNVVTIWECQLRPRKRSRTLERLSGMIG
jgi:DNA mismatch endonuclease (patch repair protein)